MADRRSDSRHAAIRSLLFAPGDDPRKLAKASPPASTVALADLEDAVAEGNKGAARETVAAALAPPPPAGARARRAVRINALDGPFAAAAVARGGAPGADAVVVPKARAAGLRSLETASLPPIIAIVETAA